MNWRIRAGRSALASVLAVSLLTAAAARGQTDPPSDTGRDSHLEPRPERFRETVDVRLQQLVVRVVDGRGRPIMGLEPKDFEIRAGKRKLPVVGVDWVSSDSPSPLPTAAELPRLVRHELKDVSHLGRRLVVFWVQADLNPVRVKGHLRMLPLTQILIDALHPDDLAAVVAFDSHLKLFQDFTTERRPIAEAIERAVRFGGKPAGHSPRTLSLGDYLDPDLAKRTATPEEALFHTAEALGRFPGEKEIVFLGWGLGRRGSAFKGRLLRAERALNRANTSVFVLDVTNADYHDLELGLRVMAHRTGGTYAKTNRFSLQATRRLARTLNGYYVLSVEVSEAPRAALEVALPGIKAEVLIRSG